VELRPLHRDWERRLDSNSLTFCCSFGHNWSYRSNFDVIIVGMETILPYLSNGI